MNKDLPKLFDYAYNALADIDHTTLEAPDQIAYAAAVSQLLIAERLSALQSSSGPLAALVNATAARRTTVPRGVVDFGSAWSHAQ